MRFKLFCALACLVLSHSATENRAFGQVFGIELHNTVMPASGGMGGATGVPLAVGLKMLAAGQITAKGVHPPETCVNPDLFFDELAPLCAPPLDDGRSLLSITRAASLPKTFPYPGPDGKEQRPRPAYYYRQSSVIPYRLKKGRLEILVIASSGNKHCVVPKGIHDPGLSAQESAEREAFEEAGARGTVDENSLGTYTQEKWGATTRVEVFPMRVEELIPEAEWEETHRGRQWLPAEKAIRKLKQPALGPMIRTLSERLQAD